MRAFIRLLLGVLAVATLVSCTRSSHAMAVWDADGCAFVVSMYFVNPDVDAEAGRMNDIGNSKATVTRAIGMDRPTCVAPAANAIPSRPKE